MHKNEVFFFNPIALRKAKILYNFGLFECNIGLSRSNKLLTRKEKKSLRFSLKTSSLFIPMAKRGYQREHVFVCNFLSF